MQREPIELARIQTKPAWRSARRGSEPAGNVAEPSGLAAAAIDEAFAHLDPTTVRHSRVDSPATGEARNAAAAATKHELPATQRTLVANLTAQLDSLDRQREQLAHLLRGIEPFGD